MTPADVSPFGAGRSEVRRVEVPGSEVLRSASLERARAGHRPDYDRGAARAGFVHLGLGAFARGHLATYADDLLALGWSSAMVRGVSLHDETTPARLRSQDGLYSVLARDGEEEELRIVGSLHAAATGSATAVDAIDADGTTFVTLTVTEKGYGLDPATGRLDERRPDIAHDLRHPATPRSAPGVVVAALARRRARGAEPPVIASLDNLVGNGRRLRRAVIDLAGLATGHEDGFVRWLTDEVHFPSSVVDRVVPATTAADVAAVQERLGLHDAVPVVTEPHRSWVLESTPGLPPLGEVGVTVVADVAAHERRKLWLLNGPHSAYAYLGLLRGHTTIAEATGDPVVDGFVQHLVRDVVEVIELPPVLEPSAYSAAVRRRFANAALGHRCVQVGADGSQKLPLRLLPVVEARSDRGLDVSRFAVVVAAWIALVGAMPLAGVGRVELDDPVAEVVAALVARHPGGNALAAAVLGAGLLGPVPSAPFTTQVGAALDALARHGLRDPVVSP